MAKRAAMIFTGILSLLSTASYAAGSWSDSQQGVTLQNRGVMRSAPALNPPAGAPVRQAPSATIESVSWNYRLYGPQPAGLQVKLCNTNNRCAALDGASGQTRAFYGQSAQSAFQMVFFVEGQGRLNPSLRIVSQQVIVNYR
ncbi:flagellar protein FlhE [Enterobacterales bacterium]|nr:flagellar protein FlhE [Enterobacterales bacterium]